MPKPVHLGNQRPGVGRIHRAGALHVRPTKELAVAPHVVRTGRHRCHDAGHVCGVVGAVAECGADDRNAIAQPRVASLAEEALDAGYSRVEDLATHSAFWLARVRV
eukprot:scaffold12992_cov58-Phaeocystis_antarctica.AAC.15